ncbi:MAG: hypothetical protein HFJ54_08370 [Clostridia bacterium]|nr:hypothetical protein [Clostridia bacterium]
MEKIAEANKDYPKLKVELETITNVEEMVEKLKDNNIDFAITNVVLDKYKEEIERKELKKSENIKVPVSLPQTSLNIVYIKGHLTKVDKEFMNRYLKQKNKK